MKKLNLLDKAIAYFSPKRGLQRAQSRSALGRGSDQGYPVPGSAKKIMKGVTASANSADRDTLGKLKGSRALSRDMYMNSPIATAAIKRARTNVAGSGLVPKPTPDGEFLGMDKETTKKWIANTQREFLLWADSTHADFTERMNFWDLQAQAFVSVLLNGDCFFMTPWKKPADASWPYDLRIRLIEADLVRNPPQEHEQFSQRMDSRTKGGIEVNRLGQVVAAHFADHYPNEWSGFDGSSPFGGKFNRVTMWNRNGLRNWWHLADFDRVGQRRGMPFLANVLEMLKTISRLSESELIGALIASTFTVIVSDSESMGGYLNEGFKPDETVTGGGTDVDASGNQVPQPKNTQDDLDLELGSGTIHYIDDTKKIDIVDPKRPSDKFEPFFNAMVKQIAAAIEIPAEQLLLEFNTSYSSARAALLEAWKFYRQRRTWLIRNFTQPIYDEWMTEAVTKGRVNAPGFFDDPIIKKAWCKAAWLGAGNGQIDPLKEAKASVMKIQNNLSTHQAEYMNDRGGDWESSIRQLENEHNLLEETGLAVDEAPDELTGPDGVKNQPPKEPDTEDDQNPEDPK